MVDPEEFDLEQTEDDDKFDDDLILEVHEQLEMASKKISELNQYKEAAENFLEYIGATSIDDAYLVVDEYRTNPSIPPSDLQEQVVALLHNLKASSISDIYAKFDELQNSTENSDLKDQVATLESSLNEIIENNVTLQNENNNYQREISILQKQIVNVQDKNRVLRLSSPSERTVVITPSRDDTRAKIEQLELENEDLKNQLEDLRTENEEYQLQIEKLEENLLKLMKVTKETTPEQKEVILQLSSPRTFLDRTESSGMFNKIQELEAEIEKLQTQNEEISSLKDRLETENIQLKKKNDLMMSSPQTSSRDPTARVQLDFSTPQKPSLESQHQQAKLAVSSPQVSFKEPSAARVQLEFSTPQKPSLESQNQQAILAVSSPQVSSRDPSAARVQLDFSTPQKPCLESKQQTKLVVSSPQISSRDPFAARVQLDFSTPQKPILESQNPTELAFSSPQVSSRESPQKAKLDFSTPKKHTAESQQDIKLFVSSPKFSSQDNDQDSLRIKELEKQIQDLQKKTRLGVSSPRFSSKSSADDEQKIAQLQQEVKQLKAKSKLGISSPKTTSTVSTMTPPKPPQSSPPKDQTADITVSLLEKIRNLNQLIEKLEAENQELKSRPIRNSTPFQMSSPKGNSIFEQFPKPEFADVLPEVDNNGLSDAELEMMRKENEKLSSLISMLEQDTNVSKPAPKSSLARPGTQHSPNHVIFRQPKNNHNEKLATVFQELFSLLSKLFLDLEIPPITPLLFEPNESGDIPIVLLAKKIIHHLQMIGEPKWLRKIVRMLDSIRELQQSSLDTLRSKA